MRIERYNVEYAEEWNKFVDDSKNGTFLFDRKYMDYHSDRFKDHSLMFYDDRNRLVAVLPANESGRTYYSHQGLTYGGYVLAPRIHGREVLDIFELTLNYLCERGFEEFYYRQIPYPYHLYSSQEEEYALWRIKAQTVACTLASCTYFGEGMPGKELVPHRRIKYDRNKLKRNGYYVEYDADIRLFWPILEDNLSVYHNASPVHSIEEMMLLKDRFPKNIVCCVANNSKGETEAGVILFLSKQVVHTQYISASKNGRRTRALYFLLGEIVDYYQNLNKYLYFDFGGCVEQDGYYLNEGLLAQKERLGGRGIVYKTWQIKIV